jgi:hypothetical protein
MYRRGRNPNEAIRTRQVLLERAAADGTTIYVVHFDRPGPWHLRRLDGGWEVSGEA